MKQAFVAIAAITMALSASVMAEFKLDSLYSDTDGDLVADIPVKSQQINPDTLVFAYTPVDNPSIYAAAWSDFLTHLSSVTGKKVRFYPVQSNDEQIAAMRVGRLHVTGFNTGSNPMAVACAGYRPFTIMAGANGSYGYEMQIITYPGSGIDRIEDIKGGRFAFTSKTSNSGFKLPSAILETDYELLAGRDFEAVFSGRHDNSILRVSSRDYPAAAIASTILTRMISRGVVGEDETRSIYRSQTFPTTSYGVAYNLNEELQDKIKEAFATFEWAGTSLQEEFGKSGEAQFIPITFKDEWAVIRKIDEASGVEYQCQ